MNNMYVSAKLITDLVRLQDAFGITSLWERGRCQASAERQRGGASNPAGNAS